jgi:hypothetical protein
MNLQKIIDIIKVIREEAPTMSSGTGGFTGAADPRGPVAGYDTVSDFRTRHGRRAKNQPIARIEAKKNVRKRN